MLRAGSVAGTLVLLVGSVQAVPPPPGETVAGVAIPFLEPAPGADPAVAFSAATFAGTVFVTRAGEIVHALPARSPGHARVREHAGWSLVEVPVRGHARPVGVDPGQSRVSRFRGNDPARWQREAPSYGAIRLGRVWPGVEVSLHAHGTNVEKRFTVEPGVSASRIRLRIRGARGLRRGEDGTLVAATDVGDVTFTAPVAWQERDGVRVPVAVAYAIRGDEYGFRVAAHDPALPVVIDPLLQSTYLGGKGQDTGLGIIVHPSTGDVYVAGETDSNDFPGTAGGAQTTNNGDVDYFVARLSADLRTIRSATYLGGGDEEDTFGALGLLAIAVHPTSGEVYVAGATRSTDFPGTAGAAQPNNAGDLDFVVARLSADLTELRQATYVGGVNGDAGTGLAFNATSGDVYVCGFGATGFPMVAGGANSTDANNLVVARLNANLTQLKQATFLGNSSGSMECSLAAVNSTTGDVYVVGDGDAVLDGTAGSAQPSAPGGGRDGCVARFSEDLTTLRRATYLGGAGDGDLPSGIVLSPAGTVYVAGQTNSPDLPGTTGAAQPTLHGTEDAFVARLTPDLSTFERVTYLGGSGEDFGYHLALHPGTGAVYVIGQTRSNDFPNTTSGVQPTPGGGGNDAFIARLDPSLVTLEQATYLGGRRFEGGSGLGIAISPLSGDVYATGDTSSSDFPGTADGAQATALGDGEAFVARLTSDILNGTPLTTTTVIPTSTTTTTLEGCAVGATFASVLCRLDALIASVNAANDLGSAKTSLLNAVTKARGQAQAASTATKAKSQKAQLKKCAKSLQAFGHKLATKKAKKAIPQGTRDALAGEATAIRADVLALRGSL
jgi:hypothetical protein